MRRAPWLFIPSILLVLGCTRPEVEAFRRQPAPVSVSVSLPSGLTDREAFQKEYASALRARLATRVVVVPEGVKPPVGAAQLQVVIRDLSPAPGRAILNRSGWNPSSPSRWSKPWIRCPVATGTTTAASARRRPRASRGWWCRS